VKSLLDVAATFELLEALGVPVVAWGSATIPLFYSAEGGPPAPWRVDTAMDAAAVARAHWSLGRGGLLLAQPPRDGLDVEPLVDAALAAARAEEISGQAVTPFVLAWIHRETGGESVRINRRLIADNAALAGEIAAAYVRG
jgi:pseudouridine-5'-phosphate glycosidase